MKTMDSRTSKILEVSVRDFIKSGDPISSLRLFRKYDFGIRPAMIRAELNRLTRLGFLDQPYASAGRAPTNQGFRFFADLSLGKSQDSFDSYLLKECKNYIRKTAWRELTQLFSQGLGILGVSYEKKKGAIYKSGLGFLVRNLERQSPHELSEIIRNFELIDKRMDYFSPILNYNQPKIFIGRENPLIKNDNLSLIGSSYNFSGNEMFILAIGPKRMDYQKVVKLLKGFNSLTNGRR